MRYPLKHLGRTGSQVTLAFLLFQSFTVLALAQCPIPADGALFVRVPLGNLLIDTSGSDVVEVEVSNPAIAIEEGCYEDHVEINATAPERVYGPIDWQIRAPRSVNLDLLTFAGTIRIAGTDGDVTARTTGGSVVVANIGGSAAMITQGGSILVGDIGGDAELRSEGGQIEIGDVNGNAELTTLGGGITTGVVSGQVRAETAGGTINIEESRGDLRAVTLAGDIIIGTAGRIQAETAGGNIISMVSHGSFQGITELGNIRVERAEASVEATSGVGDIDVRLEPTSFTGDLHVTLTASTGDIRLALPEDMPADLEAIIDRSVLREPTIRSDFPLESVSSRPNVPSVFNQTFADAPARSVTQLNGGGGSIIVRTSRGSIEIVSIPR